MVYGVVNRTSHRKKLAYAKGGVTDTAVQPLVATFNAYANWSNTNQLVQSGWGCGGGLRFKGHLLEA